MSSPGICMLLFVSEHFTDDTFSSIADHYESLHAPLHRCKFVGTNNKSQVEVTWLLSSSYKFPCVSDHTGTTEHPLSGRSMRECWEAPAGHDIPSNCANHQHWIQKGLWPCHIMGTSLPSLISNSGECASQTLTVGGQKCWLGICLHLAEWSPIPCPHHSEGHVSAMTDGVPGAYTHG